MKLLFLDLVDQYQINSFTYYPIECIKIRDRPIATKIWTDTGTDADTEF